MPEDKPGIIQICARLAIPIGLLLILAALIVWTITEPESMLKSPPVVIPGAAGIALFVLGAIIAAPWLAAIFLHKRAVVGLNVAFMTFLFLVIVLVVNVISQRRYYRWDLTAEKRFTLSEKTLNTLEHLDAGATTVTTTTLLGSSEDALRIKSLVEDYDRHSRRLKVNELDPYRDKVELDTFVKSLKEQPSSQCVVLQYGDPKENPDDYREKILEVQDFVEYPPMNPMMYGRPPPPVFKGEETLTAAVKELTDPVKPKVYFIVGHGELDTKSFKEDGLASLADMLKRDNYDADNQLNLLQTGEVPDDCDVLVIPGPQKPFDENEIEAIRAYMQREEPKAGKLLVLIRPTVIGGDVEGLRGMLADFNVQLRDNMLVLEQTVSLATGRVSARPDIYTEDWGEHPITNDLKTVSGLFYMACPVESTTPDMPPQAAGPDSSPWQVTPLAKSGRATWAETTPFVDGRFDASYDRGVEETGPFTLAVAVTGRPPQPPQYGMPPMPMPGSKARLVVVGDVTSATNQLIKSARLANQGFYLGAVNWLAEREYSVGIPPKPTRERPLNITPKGLKAVKAISWFGLPTLVIVIGALVLWRRRS